MSFIGGPKDNPHPPGVECELVERTREEGADDSVVQTLEKLPMDEFNSPNDVSGALGRLRN